MKEFITGTRSRFDAGRMLRVLTAFFVLSSGMARADEDAVQIRSSSGAHNLAGQQGSDNLKEVTDPALLEQLNASGGGRSQFFDKVMADREAVAGQAQQPIGEEVDALSRYRDYLPEQILEMSDEERGKSVPIMFINAANLAVSRFGDLANQANLNTLMYDGLADYEGAKRAFQSDLGEEPTGLLTVWQLHTLSYRASRISMTEVSFFPFDYGGHMFDTFARVKGTLKILDERIALPINHVEIECNRDEGYCEYRQIALTLPSEDSWGQSYYVGQSAYETYRITRWEGQLIDAVPLNHNTCRTNQLTLNFETKEFFEIARNRTSGDCEVLGTSLPRLEKPRISQIVDGREIVDAEFRAIRAEAYTFRSSAFRARVDALRGE